MPGKAARGGRRECAGAHDQGPRSDNAAWRVEEALDASREPLTPHPVRMNAKTIRILSFIGKAAGFGITIAAPFSAAPVGLIVFAAASLLKDVVNRAGDLMDDGKPNDSFKT